MTLAGLELREWGVSGGVLKGYRTRVRERHKNGGESATQVIKARVSGENDSLREGNKIC